MSESDLASYKPLDAATRAALYAGALESPSLDVPAGPDGQWRLPFRTAISAPDRVEAELRALIEVLECGFEYDSATMSGYFTSPVCKSREQDLELLFNLSTRFVDIACRNVFEWHLEDIERALIARKIVRVGDVSAESTRELAAIAARGFLDIPAKVVQTISILQEGLPQTGNERDGQYSDTVREFEASLIRAGELRQTALGRLAVAQEELDQAKLNLDRKVLEAREVGATWSEVGAALGMSQQAANQRWGKKAKRASRGTVST